MRSLTNAGKMLQPIIKMKQLLVIISFFVSIGSFAQFNVQENMKFLDEALVKKDTSALNRLLHEKLSYGHSNGWIESKQDVIADLLNGKLGYTAIESKGLSSQQTGDITIVRAESKIKYVMDGKEGELKLHVMQVWMRVGLQWQLIGRQSTKVN
jgi:Domain of unknown function (DUF4440)